MSPPAAISAASAALRILSGSLVCGGALPLVAALFNRVVADGTTTYLLTVAVAAVALSYLGSLRAVITHQARRRLALQTLTLAVPVLLLARTAGGLLLAQPPSRAL